MASNRTCRSARYASQRILASSCLHGQYAVEIKTWQRRSCDLCRVGIKGTSSVCVQVQFCDELHEDGSPAGEAPVAEVGLSGWFGEANIARLPPFDGDLEKDCARARIGDLQVHQANQLQTNSTSCTEQHHTQNVTLALCDVSTHPAGLPGAPRAGDAECPLCVASCLAGGNVANNPWSVSTAAVSRAARRFLK
jgi:hypothetical protein